MDQKQYWAGHEIEYQYHSIEKFVKCFKTNNLRDLKDEHCHNRFLMKADWFKDAILVIFQPVG
jgi:hypothetical protein